MMKKVLAGMALASSLLISEASAIAGLVDIEVGAGLWSSQMSGTLGDKTTSFDFEKDLGLDKTSNTYYYARFDHFVPLLPNLRYEKQAFSTSGKGNKAGTIPGTAISLGANTNTDITLDQQDLTFYWGIPGLGVLTGGILDIEFGVDVKLLDGSFGFNVAGVKQNPIDISATLPLAYLGVLVDIPFIDMGLEGSIKKIAFKDSSLEEVKLKVDYVLPIPTPLIDFSVEAGLKTLHLQIADSSISKTEFNLDNSGIFYGLNVKF